MTGGLFDKALWFAARKEIYVHPEKIVAYELGMRKIDKLVDRVPLKTYRSVTKLKFCAIITSGAFWLCRSFCQWQISSAPSTLIEL